MSDYPKPITSVDDLPKNYDALPRERFWQQYWLERGTYKFEPARADGTLRTRDEIFSIDTPPPTVSGNLHIGHVYSYTQTDMNARYRRMTGKHVFYPFGFDDNGLPTERLVEKERGIRAHEVSREDFIAMCQETAAKYETEFIELWKSLALSCDWEQYYTTIDERSRAISQASFIDLYNKGYIYRKVAPTQWDWVNQTAIAQAEIEDREVPGHFHYIKFQWADGPGQPVRGEFVIGTTRPELIPACVAVMANPESEQLVRDHEGKPVLDNAGNEVRQRDLIGKIAITPLFEVEVPILPSEKADPEKGTGVLMCCTFGDMDDVEHWQRFDLPTRVIIGKDGKYIAFSDSITRIADSETSRAIKTIKETAFLIETWPSRADRFAKQLGDHLLGLKPLQARKFLVESLASGGLLLDSVDMSHTVRFAERGDVPVEILLTPQWYVNILLAKGELLTQGRKISWHPAYMRTRYEQWVDGLNSDWCISRQRYNGVPFPVWFGRSVEELEEFVAFVSLLPESFSKELLESLGTTPNPILNAYSWFHSLFRQSSLEELAKDNPHGALTGFDTGLEEHLPAKLRAHGLTREDVRPAYKHLAQIVRKQFLPVILLAGAGELPVNPLSGVPSSVFGAYVNEISKSSKMMEISKIIQSFHPNALVWPDADVMDTWATSSVTMLLNTHFRFDASTPEAIARHGQLFPYDMRPQAHDIIRTWAFYTIAKAYFHFGEIPWQDIVISGHAQDASRLKMSKSKGNTVTPAQMVEKYSADGLRYWSGSVKLGADTVYDETKLGEGRKLINKLFNATKFALRHLLDYTPVGTGVSLSAVGTRVSASANGEQKNIAADSLTAVPTADALTGVPTQEITYPTDLWLISRLNACIERATAAHEAFEFGDAKQAIEDFFWADLCDNYLEFSKGRLYGEPLAVDAHSSGGADTPVCDFDGRQECLPHQLRLSAQATLYIAFSSVLRMLAPALPHITEECWSWYFAQWSDKGSIHLEEWPAAVGTQLAVSADAASSVPTELLTNTVSAVRKWKSERGVSIKTPLAAMRIYATGETSFSTADLAAILGDLLSTCNAQSAEIGSSTAPDEAVTTERNPVAVVCEIAAQPE